MQKVQLNETTLTLKPVAWTDCSSCIPLCSFLNLIDLIPRQPARMVNFAPKVVTMLLRDRRRVTFVGPLREGCRESRKCSRDTYPESYITKYTGIRR
jgi:hypothetical protein